MEIKPQKNMEFRDLMVELVRLFSPHTYVEVGVQRGFTFNTIAAMVPKAVAVDIQDMPRVIGRPNVEKHVMPSAQFVAIWKEPIDILFIDADHRKEAVLADFDVLSPFVREGSGLILLHDTHPVQESLLSDRFCSNAWEAAWTIRKNRKYSDFEIVTLPGPWAGMSIIRKAGRRHLSWTA